MSPLLDPALPVYARIVVAVLFLAMLAALGWALAILSMSTIGIATMLFAISFYLIEKVIGLCRRRLRARGRRNGDLRPERRPS